jgi:hypothetical protein
MYVCLWSGDGGGVVTTTEKLQSVCEVGRGSKKY